jgi:hypothetical protein
MSSQQPTCCAFAPKCLGFCQVFPDAEAFAWLLRLGQLDCLGYWVNLTSQQLYEAASRHSVPADAIPKALKDMAILVAFAVIPREMPCSSHLLASWSNA